MFQVTQKKMAHTHNVHRIRKFRKLLVRVLVVLAHTLISSSAHTSTKLNALAQQQGAVQAVWDNSVFAGVNTTTTITQLQGSWPAPHPISVETVAILVPSMDFAYAFNCSVESGLVRFWIDDHLFCSSAPDPNNAPLPPFMQMKKGQSYFLRLQFVGDMVKNESTDTEGTVAVHWAPVKNMSVMPRISSFVPIPAAVLFQPDPSHVQLARINMQRTIATGWGTWQRLNALGVSLLPEGSTITLGLCQVSSGDCMDPFAHFTPEQDRGEEEPRSEATSRPGTHAWDRGYWQLYLNWRELNVSLEWAGTNSTLGYNTDQQLSVLATVVSGNLSDFDLYITGSFAWDYGGTVTVGTNVPQIQLIQIGARAVSFAIFGTDISSNSSDNSVRVSLRSGIVAGSTSPSLTSAKAIEASIANSQKKAALSVLPGASNTLQNAATAMQSCLMWNVLFEPLEQAPFVQVSRSFTTWPYELFEWDTYFGSLMLATNPATLSLAISSIIQITKSKTLGPELDGHGFVPGYSKGCRWKAEDRTERPVAARILMLIWKRWISTPGSVEKWVLELLFNDIMDWHEWLWARRRFEPLGLAGMGSDPCFTPGTNGTQRWCKPSWGMGQLQGARFESLDNSPMYDPPDGYNLWDPVNYRMRLYDVGQSSAIAAECESMAEIADILKMSSYASTLRLRMMQMGRSIQEYMWDDGLSIYSNILFNGTKYPRISPTSFYPMLFGLASDEQVTSMITKWLSNKDRFCVPIDENHWPPKNTSGCYWGLPSISADDPAYYVPGGATGYYWRGKTWEPQVFLVYLGLQRYDHIPIARSVRNALVAQQRDLVLSVWGNKHHVCENYPSLFNPNGTICTGNQFYMWGGLGAFIGIIEDGFFNTSSYIN